MFKDMKKMEYVAPELELIELKSSLALLNASDQEAPGTGDSEGID